MYKKICITNTGFFSFFNIIFLFFIVNYISKRIFNTYYSKFYFYTCFKFANFIIITLFKYKSNYKRSNFKTSQLIINYHNLKNKKIA